MPLYHKHSQILEALAKDIPTYNNAKKIADILAVLSDPTRLRILWILCHTKECVTDIGIAIGMSAPAVSHHLKILKNLKLITATKIGKEMQYTLADTNEAKIIHNLIESMLNIKCPNQ